METSNDRLAESLSAIALRDKLIYGIIVVLLAILSFFASNVYTRLGVVELLLRDVITTKTLSEQRFQEDHTLLLSIEVSRQQRTTAIKSLEDRVARIEQRLFKLPQIPETSETLIP